MKKNYEEVLNELLNVSMQYIMSRNDSSDKWRTLMDWIVPGSLAHLERIARLYSD